MIQMNPLLLNKPTYVLLTKVQEVTEMAGLPMPQPEEEVTLRLQLEVRA